MADKFNLDGFSVDENDVCTADGGFTGIIGGGESSYGASGEIDISKKLAYVIAGASALSMTIPNGTLDSQEVIVIPSISSGSILITPDSVFGIASVTLTASGQSARFVWQTSRWYLAGTDGTKNA